MYLGDGRWQQLSYLNSQNQENPFPVYGLYVYEENTHIGLIPGTEVDFQKLNL